MNEQAFLAQILDNPDDDITRLAYADWLMEQGDPASAARGEFIQVQIQLYRRTEGLGNPTDWIDAARVPQLKAREQELLGTHLITWASPVAGLVDAYQFRRGFIEQITCESGKFLRNAEALFRAAPVQRARLTGGVSKRLADSPFLGKLSELDFQRQQIGDTGLRLLLASPHLDRLRWLDLNACYLTNRSAEALADSPVLGQLVHLNLGYNMFNIQGIQRLFASQYWGKTRSLVLTGNYYLDSRAQELLAQTLKGSPQPTLLRSVLQMSSREQREYSNARVRQLAEEAGREPDRAAEILGEGLKDGRRKVRSASAQMLAQLGVGGAPALPKLVQRLFEDSPLVRDHVAPALARLLPELPGELQTWLCLIANPLLTPATNLKATLDSPALPAEVRQGFAAVCARRLAWWEHVGKGGAGPAPVPETAALAHDHVALNAMAQQVVQQAGWHAARHHKGNRAREEATKGQRREYAWLLARLCELLQPMLSMAAPKPEPVGRARARKK